MEYGKGIYQIAEKKREQKKGIECYKYCLVQKENGWGGKAYNEKIRGLSLEGNVLKAERAQVKVQFDIDEKQKEEEAIWFSVSSSYAPEGKSGWYGMPEEGSKVWVYFPTEKEEEGFVRGGKRKEEEKSSCKEVREKGMETAKGKAIVCKEKGMEIRAKKKEVEIKLEEEKGIGIQSNPHMRIEGGGRLYIRGKEVEIEAKESLKMKTKENPSSILLENEVHIKGEEIKEEGREKG